MTPSPRDAPAPSPDRAAFLDPVRDPVLWNYFGAVDKWHGYIRFVSLPHLGDDPDIQLDRLFIEPKLARRSVPPAPEMKPDPEWRSASEVLSGNPRLVVLGDPGSGKSTLVNWVAWLFTRKTLPPEIDEAFGRLVPIPLVLRELNVHGGIDWNQLIYNFFDHPMIRPLGEKDATVRKALRERLDTMLASGQAFVLLDGIDEIGSVKVREQLRGVVKSAMRRYPKCRFLLTSRVIGYNDVPFHGYEIPKHVWDAVTSVIEKLSEEDRQNLFPEQDSPSDPEFSESARPDTRFVEKFPVFHVVPFDDTQIADYARKWYWVREPASERGAIGTAGLIQAIQSNASIRRLARIPNLLNMIALIHRVKADLPHGRAKLYDDIAHAYLQSIDRYRGLREGQDYPLEQKRRWLARVGFELQRRRGDEEAAPKKEEGRPVEATGEQSGGEILATREEVVGWIAEAMGESGYETDPDAASGFVEYIARRSGLLLPRGAGPDGLDRFAFTHLSFQEYFAACHLREVVTAPRWMDRGSTVPGHDKKDLEAYSGSKIWHETLILLFELLADKTGWPEALAEVLFGENFEKIELYTPVIVDPNEVDDLDPSELDPDINPIGVARTVLLASVAIDPYSGLPKTIRNRAIDHCCLLEVEGQNTSHFLCDPFHGPIVAPSLLDTNDDDTRNEVWARLGKAFQEASPRRIVLQSLPITSLNPITQCREVERLIVGGSRVADLSPLRELTELRELDISNTDVMDLSPLRELTELRELDISNTDVMDLSPLRNLTELRHLDISNTAVTDLSPLRGLTKLHELDISITKITDFSPLNDKFSICRLNMSNTSLSDLSFFNDFPRALEFASSNTSETDSFSQHSIIPRLSILDISFTHVRDLSPLENLPFLQDVFISHTLVDNLSPLLELKLLARLCVSNTSVSDLSPLRDLTELWYLDISYTSVTDLAPLAEMQSLRRIVVSRGADLKIPPSLRDKIVSV